MPDDETPQPVPVPDPPRPTPPAPALVVPLPTFKSARANLKSDCTFKSIRAYMKNGCTFKIIYVSVDSNKDGYNYYSGQDGLPLCSINRDDVSAWVNLDVPEETVMGEKDPVRVFPAGITISSGYQF